ncbi:MAG: hypothetical protein R3Y12_07630 [Clostridia bacterium]
MYNNCCDSNQDMIWIILLVIIILFCFGGMNTGSNCCPKHDYNPCCC